MSVDFRLLGRTGCHLCEEMELELRRALDGRDCRVTLIDIDSDPQLGERYGLEIPVLMAGEHEICHYTLDMQALDRFLSDH